tara:strand:- start:241 stop:366 length:126 start_codon:yes stop_codon:yes gene_type:complete
MRFSNYSANAIFPNVNTDFIAEDEENSFDTEIQSLTEGFLL